jgi:hypothetical protein
MTKQSVSTVRQELEAQERIYKSLYDSLRDEQALARQASAKAQKDLDPLLAGFLMREIPDLEAPSLTTLDALLRSQRNGIKPPSALIAQRNAENEVAQSALRELTAIHGSPDEIARQVSTHEDAATQAARLRAQAHDSVRDKDILLRPFDEAQAAVFKQSGKELKPAHLAAYREEGNWFKHHWRNMFDKAYPLLRPVAEHYASTSTNLTTELAARTAHKEDAEKQATALSAAQAAHTRTLQTQERMTKLMRAQHTPEQIVADVRSHLAEVMMAPLVFNAVQEAFGERFPAQARPLLQKMQVMNRLAEGLNPHKSEVKKVLDGLEDPVSKLSKAVRNGRGSKQIEFDLTGKRTQMQRHQTVMTQRLSAARDVRSATTTHDTGNDWLLWYLIFSSDSGPAHAAQPTFSSGGGGDFSGGGASGSWDDEPARNSYFRAEVLGVTPQNAASFGIAPEQLRIAPEVMHDLGLKLDISTPTSSDFNGLGSSPGTTDFGSAKLDFGSMSGGIEFDTRKLDLGNVASDLSESISSISSGLSSSDWSSSSSYDRGSSWNSSSSDSSWSSSSSSYDSGSSSSSSSFD